MGDGREIGRVGLDQNAIERRETGRLARGVSLRKRKHAPEAQMEAIAALDNSTLLRSILGDPVIDILIAVRSLEHERYGNLGPEQLADKFRMAWTL